jgi:uncharacterized repeat protein (TIGR02543 family)
MQVSPDTSEGTTDPAPGTTNVFLGDVIPITATGNPGYAFLGWTGPVADPNNPSTTVTMNQPQTVTANFAVAPPCQLDVDGIGTPPADVATDIVYIARHLLGLPPVPASFRALDPSISSDGIIAGNIDAIGSGLDVDGNGTVDVATDIVYIARHLVGLPPVPASFRVLDPSIPSDGIIAGNIDALCP